MITSLRARTLGLISRSLVQELAVDGPWALVGTQRRRIFLAINNLNNSCIMCHLLHKLSDIVFIFFIFKWLTYG